MPSFDTVSELNAHEVANALDQANRELAQRFDFKDTDTSMERAAYTDLEAGKVDALVSAVTSPSWSITCAALAASEFRTDDEGGIPVAPRALEAAATVLGRTEGATAPDAVLARIRALEIRDNAYIQIDPPPPLGLRYTPQEFDQLYAERDRRPHRPSALQSYAR